MKRKIRVGILFGGRSSEHEISLQSARSVVNAIDKTKYDITLIGIDKQGQWHLADNNTQVAIPSVENPLTILPGANSNALKLTGPNQNTSSPSSVKIDVIFPVLHGLYGEDGSIQGLLKLVNIPYVGAEVLGSAIGMDKDVMKRLLRDAGIKIPEFLVFHKHQQQFINFANIVDQLGCPFFVKPANTGSSIGINKVRNEQEFTYALKDAFNYDRKILVERFIFGREIECAVLGNENPIVSIPGEIIPHHEFYSYKSKYLDKNGATLKIPAELKEQEISLIQELAIKSFHTLCCKGLARVDFFLSKNGELYLNEINTIPGFTTISMYPKLWEASGIDYTSLIDRLIELALERFAKESELSTQYLS